MRDDDINLKMKVDPNLKDDTVLQMGDNQVTYGELKDMYKVVNQEPIRCLIYWDDVCQYTSLGLIEVINALFKTDAKISGIITPKVEVEIAKTIVFIKV